MKKLLFGTVAAAALFAFTPANAQVFIGADPGGVGVQVGPVGVGVGPDYWGDYRWHHPRDWNDYAYATPYCHFVRQRIETRHGDYWRTRRICD
ncbi:MAG: hypothetical protein ACREB8_05135 [Pseudolabrys sp.]